MTSGRRGSPAVGTGVTGTGLAMGAAVGGVGCGAPGAGGTTGIARRGALLDPRLLEDSEFDIRGTFLGRFTFPFGCQSDPTENRPLQRKCSTVPVLRQARCSLQQRLPATLSHCCRGSSRIPIIVQRAANTGSHLSSDTWLCDFPGSVKCGVPPIRIGLEKVTMGQRPGVPRRHARGKTLEISRGGAAR